jgi:hypothetical protein
VSCDTLLSALCTLSAAAVTHTHHCAFRFTTCLCYTPTRRRHRLHLLRGGDRSPAHGHRRHGVCSHRLLQCVHAKSIVYTQSIYTDCYYTVLLARPFLAMCGRPSLQDRRRLSYMRGILRGGVCVSCATQGMIKKIIPYCVSKAVRETPTKGYLHVYIHTVYNIPLYPFTGVCLSPVSERAFIGIPPPRKNTVYI